MVPTLLLLLSLLSASTVVSIEWNSCVLDAPTTRTGSDSNQPIMHSNELLSRSFEIFAAYHRNLSPTNSTTSQTSYAQCGEVEVPAEYNTDPSLNGTYAVPDENGNTNISHLRLKIARVIRPGSTKAVFHFAGGPGESSYETFGSLLEKLSDNYDADVYAMNIRGVGYQDSIHIPFYDSTTPAQFQKKFDGLDEAQQILLTYFTTDNNCRDVNYVISALNLTESQEIIMVGHSYGTYLVHRFVQMFPGIVSRAVLDSSCAGPKGTIMDETIWANSYWFPQLLDKCEKDKFCNDTFDGKPRDIIGKALISHSSCGEFTVSDAFKFTALTAFNQPTNFQLIFALLRRFSRCNFDDSSTLTMLMRIQFFNWEAAVQYFRDPSAPYDAAMLNTAVLYQIRGSEMGVLPIPSDDEIVDQMNKGPFMDFSPNPTKMFYTTRRTGNFWPWNEQSPYAKTYTTSTFTKFLLISGEIDSKTPLFLSEDFVQNVPWAHWLIVPGAGHVAGFSTPCGSQAIIQWVLDDTKNITCPPTTLPISFQVPPAITLQLQLGGDFDWYGNGSGLGALGWSLIVIGIVVALVGIVVGVVWWKKNKLKRRRDTAADRVPLIH